MLDSLRQPLEAGEVVVARANHRVTYPSRIQLIGAMNPCRCGRAGEPGHTCRRGERCAADYQGRLSGPLIDRIDIRIEVPALSASDMIRPGASETSAEVALRVAAARAIQAQRFAGLAKVRCNAQAGADLVEAMATPERAGMRLLEDAAVAMRLTARGYHRVLKLARTLADLDAAENVARIHIAEALSYRALPAELALAA